MIKDLIIIDWVPYYFPCLKRWNIFVTLDGKC